MSDCKNPIFISFFLLLMGLPALSQINTGVVFLSQKEQKKFQGLITKNPKVAYLYDSVLALAQRNLKIQAKPLKEIYYEGLLNTNPKRTSSIESLLDANRLVELIYAGYGSNRKVFGKKIKHIVLEWSSSYEATGNPINENKLTPMFWGYYIHKNLFSKRERQEVESWMHTIAQKEIERKDTPNNNWQSKRLKIIGLIGGITKNEAFIQFTLDGIKQYISTSYYPDGTSNDLKTRDALSYHVSGIEPLLDIFINYQVFDKRFGLYHYTDSMGTSVRKSIEYIIPYVSGEKSYKQWVNSKIKLDHQRAAAGIKKYQPGVLFKPEKAIPMLNWAAYYDHSLFQYICKECHCSTCNLEVLFNGPLIRGDR